MAIVTGTGIGQSEINQLGNHFSIAFPSDYIDFLNKYNGFRVMSPDYCDIHFDKVDNNYISFDALFGYQVNNENYDIVVMNDECSDELSFVENAVIIGTDPSDNFFVLITDGDKSGVYYWDRTCLHVDDKKNNYDISGEDESHHLYLCAKTFTQFFNELVSMTLKKGMSISVGL